MPIRDAKGDVEARLFFMAYTRDDPTPVDLPDPPPDATRIVINWNWDCEGVDPPPLSAASVTDCTGCNIVINVRVASPGDSGDVTQTTQVEATSVTAGVAEATQALDARTDRILEKRRWLLEHGSAP